MNADAPTWARRIRNHLAGMLSHGDLDMDGVPGETAAALVELFSEVERYAAIAKLTAAARVAETDASRGGVDPDAESWLSRTSGTSKRDAKRSLDAAKGLASAAALAALRRGRTKAGEVCDIVGLGPLPASTARTMLADAFLAAVLTDGHDALRPAGAAARPRSRPALNTIQHFELRPSRL